MVRYGLSGGAGRRRLQVAAVAVSVASAVLVAASDAHASPSGANATAALRVELRAGSLGTAYRDVALCAGLRCLAEAPSVSSSSDRPLTSTQPVGYGPAELATAYHLPAADVGRTGTIAVLETGTDPNLESDLAHYRANYGLPACTAAHGCFSRVRYDGGKPFAPTTDSDLQDAEQKAAGESSLDVDMASASCPNCHILEVQLPLKDILLSTPNDKFTADVGTATATAVRLSAAVVSISYQGETDRFSETGQPGRDLFQPGVPIVAGAGDTGFQGAKHGGWPQDLPWVTSVGGTSLTVANQGATKYDQSAWSRSGSGCETAFSAAYGQPTNVSRHCDGRRAGVDISADADPQTGLAVYDSYNPAYANPPWAVMGGTSAAAPFIAGLYARGAHRSQTVGPNTVYAAPSTAFSDVTIGSSAPANTCENQSVSPALCESGPGWDGPTGRGTPRGLAGF